MAQKLQDINDSYNSDRTAYFADPNNKGKTEDDWAGSDQAKGYNTQLVDYYKSNPGEVSAGIAQAQGQVGDKTYGGLASARLSALQSISPPKTSTAAPGFGTGTTLPYNMGSTTPQAAPPPPIDPSLLPPAYTPKDDSVESFLPGLMSKSGALMTQARGDAMRAANRRGLQNSSIAAGEGEKAALGVVVPMASQDAQQTSQKNLAAQGFGYNAALQGQQLGTQVQIANTQIGADVQKQQQADAAAMARLKQQGYNDQQIEQMRETNAIATLKQQGYNDQQIETMREASAKELQGQQLTSQEKIAADQFKNARTLQSMTNAQNSNAQAGTMVSNANATYSSYVSSIESNPNIPQDERERLINDAAARRDAEIDLANQLFGTNLTWSTGPGGGTATGTTK